MTIWGLMLTLAENKKSLGCYNPRLLDKLAVGGGVEPPRGS